MIHLIGIPVYRGPVETDGYQLDSISLSRSLSHLNPVIFLVANVDETEGIGGDAPGVVEFTIGGALRAERSQEATGRIEHLYAMVVSARNEVDG